MLAAHQGLTRECIVKDSRNKKLYKLPKLHKDILLIAPLNYTKIPKAYGQVLKLKAINHLSTNIVNPDNEYLGRYNPPVLNSINFPKQIGDQNV